jgi:phage gpG-like protein
MIRITFHVDISEAMAMLEGMKGRANNFKPVFWYARKELELANKANFVSGGLPVGGWDPRTRDYAWPILIKSGELFRSLSNLRGPPNDIGRNVAIFGTRVEHAKFHQHGIDPGYDRLGRRKGMPKRQVVFEPPLFAKRLGKVSAEYITDAFLP